VRAPVPVLSKSMSYDGIVDFAARRAIARVDDQPLHRSGPLDRGAEASGAEVPMLMLFDGPRWFSQRLRGEGWEDRGGEISDRLPRRPEALALLDFLRADAIVEVIDAEPEVEDGETTRRCTVEIDLDRVDWPPAGRGEATGAAGSLLGRLLAKALPDSTPKGVVAADLWVDGAGRLSRFSYGWMAPKEMPKDAWLTTELWDFGGPPSILDCRAQPVIDPTTLETVPSPFDVMRDR